MYKLVMFDDDFNIQNAFTGILSYSYTLDSIKYESVTDGTVQLEGIGYRFIVIDETVPDESITKEQVMNFMKEAKIKELSDECDKHILGGFIYNGDVFAFELKDQIRFSQQFSLIVYSMVTGEELDLIEWKTENNGVKEYSRDEFLAVCKAGEEHDRTHIQKFRQLESYINNTVFEEMDELRSINFDTEPEAVT